jgi:hypothetical protein
MNILAIKSMAVPVYGIAKLWFKKNLPHIMFGAGIVGIPLTTYLACKATLKIDDVLKEKEDLIEYIDDERAKLTSDEYSIEHYQQDLTIVNSQSIVKLVKLYLPAGGVMLASIALLTGGHYIMTGRVAALASAYKILDNSYKEYRKRVKEEHGEDYDNELRLSSRTVKLEEEEIKETNPSVAIARFDPQNEFIKIYGEDTTTNWQNDHQRNLWFLEAQERQANFMLDLKGHVFYNEVMDLLGLQRTKAGAITGWIKSGSTEPTKFISFGIRNAPEEIRNYYPNGLTNPPFVLDFNVDGVIFDAI